MVEYFIYLKEIKLKECRIMNKKLGCLLLAVMMVFGIFTTTFAADYFDSVDTKGTMQIARTGTGITASTGSTASVTKPLADPFPAFDYLCTLDMQKVRDKYLEYYNNWQGLLGYTNPDPTAIQALNQRLENLHITGEFTIEITYPKSFVVPDTFLENGNMNGFDDNAKLIFGNDVRTLTEGATENTITIHVEVVGKETNGSRPGYVVAKDLKDHLDTYLSNLTLACPNVGTTEYGTFVVTGKMTGFTLVDAGAAATLRVDYQTNPEKAVARCIINRPSSGKPKDDEEPETVTVIFDINGEKDIIDPIEMEPGEVLTVEDLEVPYQDGYAFEGWYLDEDLTNKVTEDLVITQDTTLYTKWKKTEPADKLNAENHYAYIVGYPEGDVRPENYISREEIATVFFRLLKDEERDAIYVKENSFSDVEVGRWSNIAISTMEKGGFVSGYEDGTFRPEEYITRAEFATIAAHMDAPVNSPAYGFSDIQGHWAEQYIADATAKGWIAGYEDGTFRPEEYITRAEAMTIINRMLLRFVNEEGLHQDAILWPDNAKSEWYYYAVEEATNSHNYVRQADGIYETWTELTPNRNWFELER